MEMERIIVTKIKKRKGAQGVAVIAKNEVGGVVCIGYETTQGYIINDSANMVGIGVITIKGKKAIINIPENPTVEINKKLIGFLKVREGTDKDYRIRGSVKRSQLKIYKKKVRIAKTEKNDKDSYILKIWKGENALKTIIKVIAINALAV